MGSSDHSMFHPFFSVRSFKRLDRSMDLHAIENPSRKLEALVEVVFLAFFACFARLLVGFGGGRLWFEIVGFFTKGVSLEGIRGFYGIHSLFQILKQLSLINSNAPNPP